MALKLLFPFPPSKPLRHKGFSFSTVASTLTLNSDFSYGPSLSKGHKTPFQAQLSLTEETLTLGKIDERMFTRVFDVAALRVPAEDCFPLENRLRGHLLNWPRVKNIARVSGDEMDDSIRRIMRENIKDADGLDIINRRIDGKAEGGGFDPVLYRDKLAKSFNCRGFVQFRNLAKMSRPKKSKKRENGLHSQSFRERKARNSYDIMEVSGCVGVDDEDMSGLLGEEFKGRRWRGSSRLLLLDERYAYKVVDELPPAIQILEALLPKGIIVPAAFEMVGHIAHLNLRDEHLPFRKLIAKVVLDKNQPKIQTVVNKIDSIQNDYRTMQLEVLAGNHSLVTTVIENGLRFQVDLATVYWNSRLSTERQRLVSSFASDDIVCDVFSGVGPIAIAAARVVKRVYANDLNPSAVDYLKGNTILNKLERKVEVCNMDGRRFINAMLSSRRLEPITQVVMNLPKDAVEYLDAFRGLFRNKPNSKDYPLPRIHVYGFSKAQDPEFDFHQKIRIALSEVGVEVEMHRVRLVAPGKWMLCGSFVLPKSVAFSESSVGLY
ncbi:tRNA (guanine(37)-N1)-methyltransferase 1 isoform X3 [Amborella trichopoda]|uniref:tRNA (guanine(37)-N1)-methyltransferase 1 isoform X3 n=1 Tax=Amborella trichopoda TaxID=13333 RepID=UPI0009C11290|nr:tRNA (guanine(37)-N1)-methyltransferase 1 isoform X3 [Amborella trichopoda]|eukprot:XP_020518178.1 tRNA (guanine(37)-N1)-methyltransferase 1 isoform X3 [Amborella trichopoda]